DQSVGGQYDLEMQAPTASITAASPRAGAAGAATRATHARRYIPEFDVLRGTAIVFVVYLHAYFSPWDVTPHSEVLAMHIIHLFAQTAVPVFFFMSAFLFAGDSSPSFARYAVAKVRRVVIPMLFWMTLALFYRVWREGGLTEYLWHHYLLFISPGSTTTSSCWRSLWWRSSSCVIGPWSGLECWRWRRSRSTWQRFTTTSPRRSMGRLRRWRTATRSCGCFSMRLGYTRGGASARWNGPGRCSGRRWPVWRASRRYISCSAKAMAYGRSRTLR